MNKAAADKILRVKDSLREMGSVLVAYSGGADSTLLAAIAHELLGKNSVAVLVTGPIFPDNEVTNALETARQAGFPVQTVESNLLSLPDFSANPPDRCYYCRRAMISALHNIAEKEDLKYIIDGNNYDDLDDYRPGRKAAIELGVRSPFVEAALTKEEIRAVSREMGLTTWNKPASPCLASRIPYGTPVTAELLHMILEGENLLHTAGFTQVRLRHHGTIARIEIVPEEMKLLVDESVRRNIIENLKKLGFTYVTMDLAGYRTGSLNIGNQGTES